MSIYLYNNYLFNIDYTFRKRLPYYGSDFVDGFVGDRTLQKTVSATIFLYFACILPAMAFGVLNAQNTSKKIFGVPKQCIITKKIFE